MERLETEKWRNWCNTGCVGSVWLTGVETDNIIRDFVWVANAQYEKLLCKYPQFRKTILLQMNKVWGGFHVGSNLTLNHSLIRRENPGRVVPTISIWDLIYNNMETTFELVALTSLIHFRAYTCSIHMCYKPRFTDCLAKRISRHENILAYFRGFACFP